MNKLYIKLLNIKIYFDNFYFLSVIFATAMCAQFILPYHYKQMSMIHCWIGSFIAFFLFSFVIFHRELFRALCCKAIGFPVKKYTFFLFGSDQVTYEGNRIKFLNIFSGFYGLFFTAASVCIIFLLNLQIESSSLPIQFKQSAKIVLVINIYMGIIDLLPVSTLDCGKVLNGILFIISKNGLWSQKIILLIGKITCMLILLWGVVMCFHGMIVGGIVIMVISAVLIRSLYVDNMNVLLNLSVAKIKLYNNQYEIVPSVLNKQFTEPENEIGILSFNDNYNNAPNILKSCETEVLPQVEDEMLLSNQRFINIKESHCGNANVIFTEKSDKIAKVIHLMSISDERVCVERNTTDFGNRAGVITSGGIASYLLKKIFT